MFPLVITGGSIWFPFASSLSTLSYKGFLFDRFGRECLPPSVGRNTSGVFVHVCVLRYVGWPKYGYLAACLFTNSCCSLTQECLLLILLLLWKKKKKIKRFLMHWAHCACAGSAASRRLVLWASRWKQYAFGMYFWVQEEGRLYGDCLGPNGP